MIMLKTNHTRHNKRDFWGREKIPLEHGIKPHLHIITNLITSIYLWIYLRMYDPKFRFFGKVHVFLKLSFYITKWPKQYENVNHPKDVSPEVTKSQHIVDCSFKKYNVLYHGNSHIFIIYTNSWTINLIHWVQRSDHAKLRYFGRRPNSHGWHNIAQFIIGNVFLFPKISKATSFTKYGLSRLLVNIATVGLRWRFLITLVSWSTLYWIQNNKKIITNDDSISFGLKETESAIIDNNVIFDIILRHSRYRFWSKKISYAR